MQTLGLSSAPQPTDNLFKRLLWPEIANGYDLDLVSQQGFWLCFVVAAFSAVMLAVTGHPIMALLVGCTYFLGGTGVRQRSVAAAILIFACYIIDRAATIEAMFLGIPGGGNPIVGIVAVMLLFANVRATFLARRWQRLETPAEISEMPERMTSSFSDKLANTLPEKLWPVGRYVFYPLAGILLALLILGMIGLPIAKARQATPQSMSIDLNQQQ